MKEFIVIYYNIVDTINRHRQEDFTNNMKHFVEDKKNNMTHLHIKCTTFYFPVKSKIKYLEFMPSFLVQFAAFQAYVSLVPG